MYSFAAILPWENQQWRRKPLRNITLILAVLRGNLKTSFRETGDGGRRGGWGGRWKGREKGRGILLYSHFLK